MTAADFDVSFMPPRSLLQKSTFCTSSKKEFCIYFYCNSIPTVFYFTTHLYIVFNLLHSYSLFHSDIDDDSILIIIMTTTSIFISQLWFVLQLLYYIYQVIMCSSAGVTRPSWPEDKKIRYPGAADIPIVRLNPFNILNIKKDGK